MSNKRKLLSRSGPNRIGQGIEFDYCCVHGVLAASECGYETIMINCNPETVSTDFDISDKLHFEPVFWEHIYDIIRHEKPEGVIVQLVVKPFLNSLKNLIVTILRLLVQSLSHLIWLKIEVAFQIC